MHQFCHVSPVIRVCHTNSTMYVTYLYKGCVGWSTNLPLFSPPPMDHEKDMDHEKALETGSDSHLGAQAFVQTNPK
jgi:hypothetical protein